MSRRQSSSGAATASRKKDSSSAHDPYEFSDEDAHDGQLRSGAKPKRGAAVAANAALSAKKANASKSDAEQMIADAIAMGATPKRTVKPSAAKPHTPARNRKAGESADAVASYREDKLAAIAAVGTVPEVERSASADRRKRAADFESGRKRARKEAAAATPAKSKAKAATATFSNKKQKDTGSAPRVRLTEAEKLRESLATLKDATLGSARAASDDGDAMEVSLEPKAKTFAARAESKPASAKQKDTASTPRVRLTEAEQLKASLAPLKDATLGSARVAKAASDKEDAMDESESTAKPAVNRKPASAKPASAKNAAAASASKKRSRSSDADSSSESSASSSESEAESDDSSAKSQRKKAGRKPKLQPRKLLESAKKAAPARKKSKRDESSSSSESDKPTSDEEEQSESDEEEDEERKAPPKRRGRPPAASKSVPASVAEKDDVCSICQDGGSVVVCEKCVHAFHPSCLEEAHADNYEFLKELADDDPLFCADVHQQCTKRTKKMTARDVAPAEPTASQLAVAFKWGPREGLRQGKRWFKSFTRQGDLYEVGSCITVANADDPGQSMVAMIESLSEERDGTKAVEVRWFVHPEETVSGRLAKHDPREVFASADIDSIDPDAIEDLADVFTQQEFDLSSAAEAEAVAAGGDGQQRRATFLVRQSYDRDSRSFKPYVAPSSAAANARNTGAGSAGAAAIRKSITPGGGGGKRGGKAAGDSVYAQACHALALSSAPRTLPRREEEHAKIKSFLLSSLRRGVADGGLYIAGVPGTGKTATVKRVVDELKVLPACPGFEYVEINGMKLPEPHQLYSVLWKSLTGKTVAPARAAVFLDQRFRSTNARRPICVLLVDELDYIMTRAQNVIYNLFDWPGRRSSRLVVVGISNTIDLPDLLLPRVHSRLGLTKIHFSPYTTADIETIIQARLQEANVTTLMDEDAIRLCAQKIAAVSGDIRRALQICRRAVEICEEEHDAVMRASGVKCSDTECGNPAVIHCVKCDEQQCATHKCAADKKHATMDIKLKRQELDEARKLAEKKSSKPAAAAAAAAASSSSASSAAPAASSSSTAVTPRHILKAISDLQNSAFISSLSTSASAHTRLLLSGMLTSIGFARQSGGGVACGGDSNPAIPLSMLVSHTERAYEARDMKKIIASMQGVRPADYPRCDMSDWDRMVQQWAESRLVTLSYNRGDRWPLVQLNVTTEDIEHAFRNDELWSKLREK